MVCSSFITKAILVLTVDFLLYFFSSFPEQELYDLINRDYADFILVSSKLSGVGGKVAHLRDPMARCVKPLYFVGRGNQTPPSRPVSPALFCDQSIIPNISLRCCQSCTLIARRSYEIYPSVPTFSNGRLRIIGFGGDCLLRVNFYIYKIILC